jgi:hypothetical protein
VNCRKGKGLKTRKAERAVTPSDEFFELERKCKRDQRVVSGGFAVVPELSEGGESGIFPLVSIKVGRRGWHLEGLAQEEATVFAYCEKKKKEGAIPR